MSKVTLADVMPSQESVWISAIGDWEILCRFSGDDVITRKLQKYYRMRRGKGMRDDDIVDPTIQIDAYCEFVFLDWRGLWDAKNPDVPVPFNKELLKQILRNNIPLFIDLVNQSRNPDLFFGTKKDDDEKKS